MFSLHAMATHGGGAGCAGRRPRRGRCSWMPKEKKVAALVADGFQEEEFFLPKVALNRAGYAVEVVSMRNDPVEIYSFFRRTGLLDVDRNIDEVSPGEYVGILVPGGANS